MTVNQNSENNLPQPVKRYIKLVKYRQKLQRPLGYIQEGEGRGTPRRTSDPGSKDESVLSKSYPRLAERTVHAYIDSPMRKSMFKLVKLDEEKKKSPRTPRTHMKKISTSAINMYFHSGDWDDSMSTSMTEYDARKDSNCDYVKTESFKKHMKQMEKRMEKDMPYKKNGAKQDQSQEIDWSFFDIYRDANVEDYSAGMTFEAAKKALFVLWDDLLIPVRRRQLFIDVHINNNVKRNEVAIIGEINLLVICRDKLIDVLEAINARESIVLEIESLNIMINKSEQDQDKASTRGLKADLLRKNVILEQLHERLQHLIQEFNEDYRDITGTKKRMTTFYYNGVDVVKELKEASAELNNSNKPIS